MPQININLGIKENKQVEIFKAKYELRNKEDAIKLVLKKFFKIKR